MLFAAPELKIPQKCSSAALASRVNHIHFNVVSNACIYGTDLYVFDSETDPPGHHAGMYACMPPCALRHAAAVAACCCCADTATQEQAAQAAA
jgi:hypothetical protein